MVKRGSFVATKGALGGVSRQDLHFRIGIRDLHEPLPPSRPNLSTDILHGNTKLGFVSPNSYSADECDVGVTSNIARRIGPGLAAGNIVTGWTHVWQLDQRNKQLPL